MPAPILLYGASGYTGRCCIDVLEQAGIPYLVGGRSREKLAAAAGPGCIGVRVAPAENLGATFRDVGCVISTVGPFARHGLPVLDAAIAAGAHYVDTTAERTFMEAALTRHDDAEAAGITALPSCGVEYAPMFLAAALLPDGPVDSYLWLDDFLPTRGSVRSMVAMAGIGPTPRPFSVTVEERRGWAIRFPGAESVFLHPDCRTHLCLRLHVAKLISPARFSDAIADRLSDPSPEVRRASGYTVVVASGSEAIRIDGQDVYASTGRFAVQLARLLVDGRAHTPGVLPVGAAIDPELALAALSLTTRRVSLG